MSYEKYYPGGWQSGESGGTPITPEALNHIENGIKQTYSDFAPAGYGYGEALISIDGTYSEVTAALDGILSTMKKGETKQLGVGITGQIYQNAAVLYKYSDTHAGLTTLSEVIHENPLVAGTWRMVKNSNVWREIEWVNPPMAPGVEYRTTQRHNGRVVYTMLIDGGLSVSGQNEVIVHAIVGATIFHRQTTVGQMSGDYIANNDINNTWSVRTSHEGAHIRTWCGAERTGLPIQHLIKYYK